MVYQQSIYVTEIGEPGSSRLKSLRTWIFSFITSLGCLAVIALLGYTGSQVLAIHATIAALYFVSSVMNILSLTLVLTLTYRFGLESGSRHSTLVYMALISITQSTALTLASAIRLQAILGARKAIENLTSLKVALIIVSIMYTSCQLILLRLASTTKPATNESRTSLKTISRSATGKNPTTIQSKIFPSGVEAISPSLSISARLAHSLRSGKSCKLCSKSSSSTLEASELDLQCGKSRVPSILGDTVHSETVPKQQQPFSGSRPASSTTSDGSCLPSASFLDQSQPTSSTKVIPFPLPVSAEQQSPEAIVLNAPRIPFAGMSAASIRSYSSSAQTAEQILQYPSTVSLVDSVSHLTVDTDPHKEEAHIHPLFRSDSVDPAPGASKTTIINAALPTDAEQVVVFHQIMSHTGLLNQTSPLAQEIEWHRTNHEINDRPSSLSEGREERATSIASDIVILPSCPNTSIKDRPSTRAINFQLLRLWEQLSGARVEG